MPDKITSRNLHYEQKLPPFLAKLRGQQVSSSSSPDPILAARRRPGRVRSASEEAEDAPVVVDEEGNVVHIDPRSLAQEDDSGEEDDGKNNGKKLEKSEHGDEKKEPERIAEIGASKKRKAGRVVGASDDEDADIARAVKAVREAAGKGSRDGDGDAKKRTGKDEKVTTKDAKKSGKKKAKKIKLSFGDDEGE